MIPRGANKVKKDRLFCVALTATACLFAAGCCPKQTARPLGPQQTLAAFIERSKAGDHSLARELIAKSRHDKLSAKQLEALMGDHPKAFQDTEKAMQEESKSLREWRLVLEDGSQVILHHESEGWRIFAGPILPSDGSSPESALDEFLKAVESGDCEALTRCAPPDVRSRLPSKRLEKGCVEQIESLRQTAGLIRQARKGLVKTSPERAELPYSEHRKLVLVKRGQRWYVNDL